MILIKFGQYINEMTAVAVDNFDNCGLTPINYKDSMPTLTHSLNLLRFHLSIRRQQIYSSQHGLGRLGELAELIPGLSSQLYVSVHSSFQVPSGLPLLLSRCPVVSLFSFAGAQWSPSSPLQVPSGLPLLLCRCPVVSLFSFSQVVSI